LNTPGTGTKARISSVTRVPFKLLRSRSSTPRNRFLSFKSMSLGTELTDVSRAKIKSIDMPEYVNLMMGTNADGTGVNSSIVSVPVSLLTACSRGG